MSTSAEYALKVARITKEDAVAKWGIGEDIQPVVFGWKNDDVVLVGSVAPHVAKRDRAPLFMLGTSFSSKRLGADAMTVVFDGLFATGETEDDVPKRFAEGDQAASEALLALHVPFGAAASLWALPYVLRLGRVIDWSPVVQLESHAATGYVKVIRDAAEMEWEGDEHSLSVHGLDVVL